MVFKNANKFSYMLFAKSASFKAYMKKLHEKADEHVNGEKKAQGVLEYVLIFVVVGLALVKGLQIVRDKLNSKLKEAGSSIDSAGN
ncbi:hypothetical protein ACTNDZ_12430 [Selenomonas montiformis]|uniref:hypothetical protein n=1 Tax=Selenomonas montiformis TaxID=2652285 RepID=UPI003F89FD12